MPLKEGECKPEILRAPHHKLTMRQDAWPSSAAFDAIASALSSDAERKDAIKKGGAIFTFTLKNEQGEQESWHIDLKETGTVGKGLAPEGKKPGGKFLSFVTNSMACG